MHKGENVRKHAKTALKKLAHCDLFSLNLKKNNPKKQKTKKKQTNPAEIKRIDNRSQRSDFHQSHDAVISNLENNESL